METRSGAAATASRFGAMLPSPTLDSAGATNPFDTENAYHFSRYAAFSDGQLTHPEAPNSPVTALEEFVHDGFRALVLNPKFTCVAAKSAFNKDNYRFGLYEGNAANLAVTEGLARDLFTFTQDQDDELREQGFSTFVASFTGPVIAAEEQWERLVWSQLQRLHDLDAPLHPWDPAVSADPADPEFSFSFAGRAFFVVGLHPASTRLTRRFAFPTLVFNAHFQFEELREAGKYHRMQEVMRSRDVALQGSINPNLSDFGEASDARQYSGRAVEAAWQCPFRAHPAAPSSDLDADELDGQGNLR
ncbi:MAG: YqcI/YcgG family protein [Cytophagales bacterium]|nr:YqcI/YcgG family protein [Armatimonadota bacterium]